MASSKRSGFHGKLTAFSKMNRIHLKKWLQFKEWFPLKGIAFLPMLQGFCINIKQSKLQKKI